MCLRSCLFWEQRRTRLIALGAERNGYRSYIFSYKTEVITIPHYSSLNLLEPTLRKTSRTSTSVLSDPNDDGPGDADSIEIGRIDDRGLTGDDGGIGWVTDFDFPWKNRVNEDVEVWRSIFGREGASKKVTEARFEIRSFSFSARGLDGSSGELESAAWIWECRLACRTWSSLEGGVV